MRLQQENSQQQASKPIEVKPIVKPIPIEDDDYDIEDEIQETKEAIRNPKIQEKPIEKKINPQNQEIEKEVVDSQKIIMQIESLQNNGIFRLELLGQLEEIKRALTVIAGVLVDSFGDGKTTG
jgi:hypothetical protein